MSRELYTLRQQHEAAVYDTRATEVLAQLPDQALIVDSSTPPYPNREHVAFLDFLFGRLGDPAGKRVLEVGCGSGTISTYLALRGARAVGVDVSAGMLDVARRRAEVNGISARVELHAGAVEDLGEPAGSFDAVIANQVLHHLDLPRALPNVARLIGDDGVALCAEPVLFTPDAVRRARYSAVVTKFFPSRADTPDERSLDIGDVTLVRSAFAYSEMHPFQATTRLQNFVELSDRTFHRLERFDDALLRRAPGAWRIARYVVLVLAGTKASLQSHRKAR